MTQTPPTDALKYRPTDTLEPPMPTITPRQIHELADIAGLQLDDARAETIAARLESMLEALDEIPADALASVEPAITFAPYEAADE